MWIGYGTQRKISNIGAQSSLKASDLKIPSSNLTGALAGRISGVISVQRSGEPGKNVADIWIRGISTPNSAAPLILVDGVERSFNDIDPEDVESLTILKDASAAALYGARAMNGVVVITTKRGTMGKPSITYSFKGSASVLPKAIPMLNGDQYSTLIPEAFINRNGSTLKYTKRPRVQLRPQ